MGRVAMLTRYFLGLSLAGSLLLTGCGKKTPAVTPPPTSTAVQPAAGDQAAAQLARGDYLVKHVALCLDCHSTRDWSIETAPIIPGTEGGGGELFPGPHGKLIAPNITPAAIGKWTDDQLYAALTAGQRPDGTHLFPIMTWPAYSQLAEDDLRAIIAVIRTLKPITAMPPASELTVPVEEIAKSIPVAKERPARPAPSDPVAYGRYLVNAAGCIDCHTQMGPEGPLPNMAFAGGMRFDLPSGPVVSANLTSDKTGLGDWDEEMFLGRFTAYRDRQRLSKLMAGQRNTIMPWHAYSQMTDDDLKAIYAYLRTLPAVVNEVEHFPDN
jgi:cytochrome c553